jgi:hypothetical protein
MLLNLKLYKQEFPDSSLLFHFYLDGHQRPISAVQGLGLDRVDTRIVGSNPARGMHVCLCF